MGGLAEWLLRGSRKAVGESPCRFESCTLRKYKYKLAYLRSILVLYEDGGLEREGVGKREFPLAEILKPRGFRERMKMSDVRCPAPSANLYFLFYLIY